MIIHARSYGAIQDSVVIICVQLCLYVFLSVVCQNARVNAGLCILQQSHVYFCRRFLDRPYNDRMGAGGYLLLSLVPGNTVQLKQSDSTTTSQPAIFFRNLFGCTGDNCWFYVTVAVLKNTVSII